MGLLFLLCYYALPEMHVHLLHSLQHQKFSNNVIRNVTASNLQYVRMSDAENKYFLLY